MTDETEHILQDDETAPDQPVLTGEDGKPLVENINVKAGETQTPKSDEPDEGTDNIGDDKEELREDLKGDSLGGTTQIPDPDEDTSASG